MVDTLSTLSATAKQFYDKKLLIVAEAAQVFYPAGQKRNLKRNSGNQISWRRFNALSVNTTPLVEGVTPTSTSLSMTEVTATVDHYGGFVTVSDQLEMMAIDPVIMEATPVMGQQAGESVETIVVNIIKAGTSVLYATGTLRNQQSAANPMTIALIQRGVRTLTTNNAQFFKAPAQNNLVGVGEVLVFLHPRQVFDVKRDPEWKSHVTESPGYTKLYSGEIAMIDGARIIQSTLAPVFTGEGAASADVYGAIMVAEEAFGVVDVAGTGKFETIVKQLGSGGTADPLNQRATSGWKSQFVSKILNNNFLVRLESGVSA